MELNQITSNSSRDFRRIPLIVLSCFAIILGLSLLYHVQYFFGFGLGSILIDFLLPFLGGEGLPVYTFQFLGVFLNFLSVILPLIFGIKYLHSSFSGEESSPLKEVIPAPRGKRKFFDLKSNIIIFVLFLLFEFFQSIYMSSGSGEEGWGVLFFNFIAVAVVFIYYIISLCIYIFSLEIKENKKFLISFIVVILLSLYQTYSFISLDIKLNSLKAKNDQAREEFKNTENILAKRLLEIDTVGTIIEPEIQSMIATHNAVLVKLLNDPTKDKKGVLNKNILESLFTNYRKDLISNTNFIKNKDEYNNLVYGNLTEEQRTEQAKSSNLDRATLRKMREMRASFERFVAFQKIEDLCHATVARYDIEANNESYYFVTLDGGLVFRIKYNFVTGEESTISSNKLKWFDDKNVSICGHVLPINTFPSFFYIMPHDPSKRRLVGTDDASMSYFVYSSELERKWKEFIESGSFTP